MKNIRLMISLSIGCLLLFTACQKETLELEPVVAEAELPNPEFKTINNYNLKIVSQNVGWLNSPAPGGFRNKAADMADWLWENQSDADVIVIQEAFDVFAQIAFFTRFSQLAGDTFYITDISKAKNGALPWNKGHGIIILSKFPFLNEEHVDFNVCHGDLISGCGGDCLADKGFVVVTLNLGSGKKAYVLGTHLDADDCTGDKIARYKEMQKIDEHIDMGSYNHNYPFLVVGDLNINTRNVSNPNPNSEAVLGGWSFNHNYNIATGGMVINHHYIVPNYGSNYKYMKATLQSWASWANGPSDNNTHGWNTSADGKLLDYIMIRNDFKQPFNHNTSDYNSICSHIFITEALSDHCCVVDHLAFQFDSSNTVDPNSECDNNRPCASDEICIGGQCIPL